MYDSESELLFHLKRSLISLQLPVVLDDFLSLNNKIFFTASWCREHKIAKIFLDDILPVVKIFIVFILPISDGHKIYFLFMTFSPSFLHVAYLNAPICIEYQWFEFAIQQSLNIYEKIHFLEISISFTCVLLTFNYSHFFFVQNKPTLIIVASVVNMEFFSVEIVKGKPEHVLKRNRIKKYFYAEIIFMAILYSA